MLGGWDGAGLQSAPLLSAGYSNATLTRLSNGEQSFVVKHTKLSADWTACRTNDARGREALLLSDEAFRPVWEIFACPYIAYATGDGEIELLMHDLTEWLLPDVRAPLAEDQEAAILRALARMHARFWGARAPSCAWLVTAEQYADVLAPCVAGDDGALAVLPPVLRESVPRGWGAALSRMPGPTRERLTCRGEICAREWDALPRTLVHGDVKVANFALLADGGVSVFDWAIAGVAPCSVDLGWYLAINASRLTAPKEEIIRRYRAQLEAALGERLDHALWAKIECAAILSGARMLLWSKALALEAGRAGAQEEWDWWMERLRV